MSTLHVENLKGLSSGGNANKVILSNDQTLYAPNHIVQVLTQELTAITTTTSTSDVATGFTLTITPKSTASKIKVTAGMNGTQVNAVQSAIAFHLYKNGSFHKYLHAVVGYADPVQYNSDTTLMYVDSPSTTSAVTYAIYWKRGYGSGTCYLNNYTTSNNTTRSWFTVEEIAQ